MTDYNDITDRPPRQDGSAGRAFMDALNRIEARLGAIERDLVDLNARIDYLGQPYQPAAEPAARHPEPRRRRGGGAIIAWLIILALLGGGAYYILSSDERMDYLTNLITGDGSTPGAGLAGRDGAPGAGVDGGDQSSLPSERDGATGGTASLTSGQTPGQTPDQTPGQTPGQADQDPVVANASLPPSPPDEQGAGPETGTPPVSAGTTDDQAGPADIADPGTVGQPPGATASGPPGDGAAADGSPPAATAGTASDDGTPDIPTADAGDAPTAEDPAGDADPPDDTQIVARSLPSPDDPAPIPEDASDGLRALVRSALAGIADAQHDLATLYAVGQGVDQSWERAAYWYRRSADAGVVNAIYNYGVLLENGQGVAQDSAEAITYFTRAAEAGHEDAQYALGLAYARGRGVERDLGEASQWLQAASANGRPDGAFQLGRLFEQGIDGAPDLAAAAGWYRIAAEQGVEPAAEALERLTGAGLESASPQQQAANAVPVPDDTPEPLPVAPAEEMSREQIRTIQERLNALGFDAGPADGLMGNRTGSAIEAFEQSVGFPVTGEPSSDLMDLLDAMSDSGTSG